ncbi:MAG: efflux transporter periplasmic adaptor subunit [Ramlibacter sp.]|nr:efflux transporter periplasmic adaptor subunit [Ramlibacter sp.]
MSVFLCNPIRLLALAALCGPLLQPAAFAQAASPRADERPPVAAPAAAPLASAADATDIRALIVAEREATISSQFAGRLTAVTKQVGDTFREGELLASFDCNERRSAVKSAQADVLGARETHLAKLKLQSLGAVSDLDVTMAAANAEKAQSQLELAKTQERYCVVLAPYSGKVVKVRAKAFESVSLGQPLLEIVNPASLRAQLFVPSNWIRWIKPGTPFLLVIDETARSYQGRVHKISGRVDGASQTMEITGAFDQVPGQLLPGMIGKASFKGVR